MIPSIGRIFAAFVFLAPALFSQDAAVPASVQQISFKFDRPIPGVLVPHYIIELHGDGTGLYHAEIPVAQAAGSKAVASNPDVQMPEAQTIDRPLTFSPATVKNAFTSIQQLRSSDVPCDFKGKNIANTGTKTLSYRDADGEGTCTYNFSENKAVSQLTSLFQGIALTLEEGRSLDFKHRFDRLGLDAEMSALADNVESGRALELGNIASTLRSIAADTELIQRVRLRAAKLLERAKADAENGG